MGDLPPKDLKNQGRLNRDIMREIAPSFGLEAVAIFSVNEDWSALRLKLD